MKLLDSLTVYSGSQKRYIELYHGDLTVMLPEEAVDVLVVSAFPDDYSPLAGTLIGALYQKGISVRALSLEKSSDLRGSFSCWMSREVDSTDPDIQFKRILCFEPPVRGKPSEVVGDIFQSLMPFVTADPPITKIAMPLVATGNQRMPIADMLEPLIDAAVHWLALGLPVTHLKIVSHSEQKALEMKGAFSILKKHYANFAPLISPSKFKHDVFISYSHENTNEVSFFVEELRRSDPNIRIFFDQKSLNPGIAWQQELYEALDDCAKVVAFYSPTYLTSKVCKEEFNIALFRHRNSENGTLIPIYLYTANLPTYMHLIQFVDCREGNRDKLQAACETVHLSLNH